VAFNPGAMNTGIFKIQTLAHGVAGEITGVDAIDVRVELLDEVIAEVAGHRGASSHVEMCDGTFEDVSSIPQNGHAVSRGNSRPLALVMVVSAMRSLLLRRAGEQIIDPRLRIMVVCIFVQNVLFNEQIFNP